MTDVRKLVSSAMRRTSSSGLRVYKATDATGPRDPIPTQTLVTRGLDGADATPATDGWKAPFSAGSVVGRYQIIDEIGAGHVLFGSDYPHPEGLAEPCSYVGHLPPGLAGDDVAAIMGGNLARLMRVPATV